MSDKTAVGQRLESLNISQEFDGYSKVRITLTNPDGETHDITAGNNNGRTLSITMPQEMDEAQARAAANAILQRLTNRRFQYQPYTATGAMVDPAAELGDGVTVNGEYSGIYAQDINFDQLMLSDISAPASEDIDHEFPYKSPEERAIERNFLNAYAKLSINTDAIQAEVVRATQAEGTLSTRVTQNAESITSEVVRATAAEGALSSRITQNASSITAEVSRATTAEAGKLNTTGGSQSFAWSLLPTAFTLKNNGTEVFRANASGIYVKGNGEFTGKVTATSGEFTGSITATGGKIGGFNIGSSALWNNISSMSGTQTNGVYVGTDGIKLGQGFKVTSSGAVTASNLSVTGGSITGGSINLGNGAFIVNSSGAVTASNLTLNGGSIHIGDNFSVDSSGNVNANNMSITGTLTVAGQQITAANLYNGAFQAANNYTSWNGTTNTVNANAGSWNGTTSTVNSNGGNWTTGYNFAYGNANSYANAISEGSGSWPQFFRATAISATSRLITDDALFVGGWSDNKQAAWQSTTVVTNAWLIENQGSPIRIKDYYGTDRYITDWAGLGKSTSTIYYLGRGSSPW